MRKPDKKAEKLFLWLAGVCVVALLVVIPRAFSANSGEALADANSSPVADFDHKAKQLFEAYNQTTPSYMNGNSTARSLNYYYSLRQYPGSPPYIPHDLKDEKGAMTDCLSCHERGGFTQAMNRFAPVTPHPEHTACDQCHVKPVVKTLFKGNDWVSVQPPKLGKSALGGAPPPIAHSLQMRENCVACHAGPGTVVPIRVEHPMRGNCRQCHVSEEIKAIFTRTPTNK